jgi:hypothetical protein
MHRSQQLASLSSIHRRSKCPLCTCPITRREINHLLTDTHQYASGSNEVVVEEATCQREHIWMEVYDNNGLVAAWGA